jgi:hypothetical protein
MPFQASISAGLAMVVLGKTPVRVGTLAFGLCDLTHKSQRTKKQFILIPQGRILFFSVTQEAFVVKSFCERYIHKILKTNLALECMDIILEVGSFILCGLIDGL